MKRFTALILVLLMLVSGAEALADYVVTQSGGNDYARANQQLALRAEPNTTSDFIGFYYRAGDWIQLYGRCWDCENQIWWVLCGFMANGEEVLGWTGAKRFDGNTYDLYGLPLFEERYGAKPQKQESYCEPQPVTGVWAAANQKLYLRTGPATSYEGHGSYYVEGEYIWITAKHWDSTNHIYWLECTFNYNGAYITGWTGRKRFDIAQSDLDKLPNR